MHLLSLFLLSLKINYTQKVDVIIYFLRENRAFVRFSSNSLSADRLIGANCGDGLSDSCDLEFGDSQQFSVEKGYMAHSSIWSTPPCGPLLPSIPYFVPDAVLTNYITTVHNTDMHTTTFSFNCLWIGGRWTDG